MAEQVVYPGIEFEFLLRVVVPARGDDEEQSFELSMTARPAPQFRVRHSFETRDEAFASAVYDTMADTAFEQFGRELARRFGASGEVEIR